jgi:hypothetical protein
MRNWKRTITHIPFYKKHFDTIPAIQGIEQAAVSQSNSKFQIINQGVGSLLYANLNQGDMIRTRVGSIVATAGPVETQLKPFNSIKQSLIHKLTGGSFFMEKVGIHNVSL